MTTVVFRDCTIVTCDGPPDGDARARLRIREEAAIALEDDRVSFLGATEDAPDADETYRGGVVFPGLVDPHTHLVFAGSRVEELARKMRGEDYQQIAASGGGIQSTVRATRSADDDTLFPLAGARARAMRDHGVTTVEIKSGYGLSLEAELRLLRIAQWLDEEGTVRTVRTLLGAHAVPSGRERAEYLLEVGRMIDEVASGLAEGCDVYVDEGAFTLDEARVVLEHAHSRKLRVKAHAGQFRDLGAPELVASLGGLSCDHLEQVSDEGLRAMARANVTAVLLPGAWRTLRQTPPDARRFASFGVRVAVGTDCNPGTSPCVDLPLCAALAMRDAGLDPDEALLAVTRNAGRALGHDELGRLRVGGPADLAHFEALGDPLELVYALGGVRASRVAVRGRVFAAENVPLRW